MCCAFVELTAYIEAENIHNKQNEPIPVFSVTQENGFCVNYFSKEVAGTDKSTYKIVPRGYFAYNPLRVNVGSLDWQNVEDRVLISSRYVVFKLTTDKIDPRYLTHLLKSEPYLHVIKESCRGTVRPELTIHLLKKIKIDLIPLDEQKRIVHLLDQTKKQIKRVQSIIQTLEDLVKSRFIEMFGTRETYSEKWIMKPFTSCCDVLYGFPFNSELFNENSEGMPLIRIRDINTGFSNTYTTEKVDPMYEIHNGDILVGMDGDFCAKKWTSGTALLNQRTCRMKGKADIINDQFMLHYLNPELQQIHRNTSSTTVKHLSAKEINKMKIPQPPLKLQEEFAAFVEQVDKSKYAFEQQLTDLDELYKSLENKYFCTSEGM